MLIAGGDRLRADGRPGPGRADPALGRPPSSAQRGPHGGRRAPHRRCASRILPAIDELLAGCSVGRRPTGCSTRRRCGSSSARSARRTDFDALIVAFGLANVLAVIPITPGGLGIIDGGLPIALVGFGLTAAHGVLGVGDVPPRPVLLPDRARRRPLRHACASGRGASSAASDCGDCATSPPTRRTTSERSTSRVRFRRDASKAAADATPTVPIERAGRPIWRRRRSSYCRRA